MHEDFSRNLWKKMSQQIKIDKLNCSLTSESVASTACRFLSHNTSGACAAARNLT